MKIKIGARPRAQVERERNWWRSHREYRDLFDLEYEAALRLLMATPTVGSACPTQKRPHLRCVLLGKTGNHIYYTIEQDGMVVMIHGIRPGFPVPDKSSRRRYFSVHERHGCGNTDVVTSGGSESKAGLRAA